MRYKVLWIDDEYKKQDDVIGDAEQDGIDIFPFESHEEGIRELQENSNFHAVILDAKVKNKKDDIVTNLEGLRASRDFLIEYNKTQYLPFFIFTGQPDYQDNIVFRESYGEYYVKGKDNENLFQDILKAQEKRPETQARKDFPESFNVFDKGILGSNEKNLFLEIISSYEVRDHRKKNINTQRDLLEAIFKSLNNPIPCIPKELIPNGRPNLESCTVYLENRRTKDGRNGFVTLDYAVKKDISAAIRKLKESTNQYSHLNDEEQVKFPFLANFYLIHEILCWLPDFVEEHYPNYI